MPINRLIRNSASAPPAPGYYKFISGPNGPRVLDPNGNVLRLRPEPGTPGEAAVAATATIDPEGANNAILVTKDVPGAGGNTGAFLTIAGNPANQFAIAVVLNEGGLVVSGGNRYRIELAILEGPLAGTYQLVYAGLGGVLNTHRWASADNRVSVFADAQIGGVPVWRVRLVSPDEDPGDEFVLFEATAATQWPDDAVYEVDSFIGVGFDSHEVEDCNNLLPTAAQAIAAINAADVPFTAENAPGSDGTGTLAAAIANFAGGVSPSVSGVPGDMLYDDNNFYFLTDEGWMRVLRIDSSGNPMIADAPAFITAIGAMTAGAEGDKFLTVDNSGTPVEAANALKAATAAAGLLLPGGSARSASNMVTVIIPPGFYDFEDTPWVVDQPFIRFVGIGMPVLQRMKTIVAPGTGNDSTGLLVRSADNVHFEGLRLQSNLSPAALHEDTANATYFPTVAGPNCSFTKCVFSSVASVGNALGARADWPFDETWTDCDAAAGVTMSQNSEDGIYVVTTAKLTRCKNSGDFGFLFSAFGNGTDNGTSFGGIAEDCVFRPPYRIEAAGRMFRCRSTNGSFPTPQTGGKVRLCLNADFSEANLG